MMIQTQTARAPARDCRRQMFVVMLGESLHDAVVRHRGAYGPGPLIMARNFNSVPAGRRALQRAVA